MTSRTWMGVANICMLMASAAALPINPRFFAFSSYIGPVVNLTFNDPAVMRVASTLRLGSLRYPGGSTTSHWNYSSGWWVDGYESVYANRTRAFPQGTFTPDSYMRSGSLGTTLRAPPTWNLNLATIARDSWDPPNIKDPPAQIDTLKRMGVPVAYLELDNEDADEPLKPYIESAQGVVARARAVFPNAKISIIGCFKLHPACWKTLKDEHRRGLFDAVTIHHYGPNKKTVDKAATDILRRSATLASVWRDMRSRERYVAKHVSHNVAIWLDEFNWGGPWAGTMWANETHGGLRGIFWASYVLAAIEVTAEAKSAGRTGYDALMSYSLFYQNSSDWSKWASCASVPDQRDRPDLVRFGGVAQVYAHFAKVALDSGYTDVDPLPNMSTATVPPGVPGEPGEPVEGSPCVLAVRFTTTNNTSSTATATTNNTTTTTTTTTVTTPAQASRNTIVAVNVCPTAAKIDAGIAGVTTTARVVNTTTYSGLDRGGWVFADNISSLLSPPWEGGPLHAHVSPGLPSSVPPVSLVFIKIESV